MAPRLALKARLASVQLPGRRILAVDELVGMPRHANKHTLRVSTGGALEWTAGLPKWSQVLLLINLCLGITAVKTALEAKAAKGKKK